MWNTESSDSDSASSTGNALAGIMTIFLSGIIGFTAVFLGEQVLLRQIVNPILFDWRVITVALAILGLTVGTVLALAMGLMIAKSISEPMYGGRSEFTLIGIGGMIGELCALVLWAIVWGLNVDTNSRSVIRGDSVLAVGIAAVLLAFLFYDFYRTEPSASTSAEKNGLDPQTVRDRTSGWSDDANPRVNNNAPRQVQVSTRSNAYPSDQAVSSRNPIRQQVEPSELDFDWEFSPDVDFSDIGGMDELKQELFVEVIKPYREKEKAKKLGVGASNIVFHGPPGTGKTYMARALASELDFPFVHLSGSDVQSRWINASAEKIAELFSEARELADHDGGAVVFLDELDTVLKARTSGENAHEEDIKVVNELLRYLEETKEHDILFLGATNRLSALDEAGIRPGRIDRKIHIGKPDRQTREAILRVQLQKRNSEISDDAITRFAERAEGLVPADLQLMIERAAKRALARSNEAIHTEDLDAAMTEINP